MNSVTNKTRLAEKLKTKKTTNLQKKKQYERNKRTLIRKQNESNREKKTE